MKNMKNKEALLVEVNRIREMMGLNLIMEQGIGTLTKKVLGFFGYTDEAMEAVGKNIDVDVLVKNSVDALETKALQKGIDIANATEDQLLKLFDESPTLKNEIETLYRQATKDAADKLIAKIGTLPSEITDLVVRATSTKLHPSMAQRASDLYDTIGTRLDNLIDETQKTGKQIPKDLQDLKNLITAKQIEADEMVNFKSKQKTDSNVTPKNDVNSSDGPQSYLDKYSQEELEKMHGFASWKPFGKTLDMMSGWKFHVFGEDLKDAIYLESVLKPIVEKWGAEAKVGGTNQTSGMYDSMKPGGAQYGKQGATIYIPVDVINSGRQQDMLTDIQSAISGYKKGGNISGDQTLTPSIHYRYEYVGPVPKDGLPRGNARAMYNTNDGGPYKPDDVEDLFTKKLIDDEELADFDVNRDLYDEYIKSGNEDQMYDWLKTLPKEEMDDIYKHIEEKKLLKQQDKPRTTDGPSNWSDYQDPNKGKNPYYGTGSN